MLKLDRTGCLGSLDKEILVFEDAPLLESFSLLGDASSSSLPSRLSGRQSSNGYQRQDLGYLSDHDMGELKVIDADEPENLPD